MSAVLNQGHEPHLWKGTVATAGGWSAVNLFILFFVGDIHGAAAQADQAPTPVPGTFRRFHGDWFYNLVVQFLDRFPPKRVRACEIPDLPATLMVSPGFRSH